MLNCWQVFSLFVSFVASYAPLAAGASNVAAHRLSAVPAEGIGTLSPTDGQSRDIQSRKTLSPQDRQSWDTQSPRRLVHKTDSPQTDSPGTLSPQDRQSPRQLVPRQIVPRQIVPGHLVPRHLVPRHLVPRHLVPGCLIPKPDGYKIQSHNRQFQTSSPRMFQLKYISIVL